MADTVLTNEGREALGAALDFYLNSEDRDNAFLESLEGLHDALLGVDLADHDGYELVAVILWSALIEMCVRYPDGE